MCCHDQGPWLTGAGQAQIVLLLLYVSKKILELGRIHEYQEDR